jgi:hypothetical protein
MTATRANKVLWAFKRFCSTLKYSINLQYKGFYVKKWWSLIRNNFSGSGSDLAKKFRIRIRSTSYLTILQVFQTIILLFHRYIFDTQFYFFFFVVYCATDS